MNENNTPNVNTSTQPVEQNQVVIPTTENNPDNMVMPNNGLNPNTMMTPVEPTTQKPVQAESIKPPIDKRNLIIGIVTVLFIIIGFVVYKVITTPKDEVKEIIESEKLTKEQKEKDIDEPVTLSDHAATQYISELEYIVGYFGKDLPSKTSNIKNDELLTFAVYKLINEKKEGLPDDIKYIEISSIITKTFGKDHKFELENVNCPAGDDLLYEYNTETNSLERRGEHGHGGPGYNRNKIFLIEATKTKEEIVIKTRVLYAGLCSDVCGPIENIYKDAKATESIYQPTEEYEDEAKVYKEAYEKVKDKLPTTTFIYKKQSNNNYGLSEIKVK